MNRTKNTISFLLLSAAFTTPATAQIFDDWEARPNISLKYKFNNKLSVAGTYYLYLDKNMSQYKKSVIGTEVGYKINSWMEAGIEYRYGIEPNEHYHDIRYSFTFDHSLSRKWKIEFRPAVQQEFISFKKVHLAIHPVEYYLRNRLTIIYKLTRKVDFYVFTENYLSPYQGHLSFHRQKSALGAEFEIGNRSKIETRFEVLNKKNGEMIARPNLSFSYTLGYVKKK